MTDRRDAEAKATLAEIQDELSRTTHEAKRRALVEEFMSVGHDRSRASEEEIVPLIETVLRASTRHDSHGEYRGQFPSLLRFAGNEQTLGRDGMDEYGIAARMVRDFMRGNQVILEPGDPMRNAGITKSAMILEGLVARTLFRTGPIESP